MFEQRNIKYVYNKTLRIVKDFLLSAKSKEFLFFLFFLFIAGAFWLMLTLNDEYETEFSVPVRLRSVPDNVVITSEPPSELRIKVRDKGTVLLNYMLGKSFSPVSLDFNDHSGVNNHIRIYLSEFEKNVQTQLNASTRLLSIKPDTLDYIYSTGLSRKVPVRPTGTVTTERQYYIPDTLYNPDSVVVYAPANILDTIRYAYTEPVILNELSDTAKVNVSIMPVRGAKFIPNTVELTFPTDVYTEKTVEVPIYGINFPADRVLRTFPSRVSITFQVGLSRFKEVDADDFVITVPYSEVARLQSDKYTLSLKSTPEGIRNIRINPAQVDFLIEQDSVNED